MFSSKYSPPKITHKTHLWRPRLLEFIARQGASLPYIFIQGNPGQGKTTLAAQLVQETGQSSYWYQLDSKDNDPLLLLRNFLICLEKNSSHPWPRDLTQLFDQQSLSIKDTQRITELVSEKLEVEESEIGLLVIEDLHYLHSCSPGWQVLMAIIKNKPQHLKVIMTSRQTLPSSVEPATPANKTLIINNKQLAFTLHETGSLFQNYCQTVINPGQIYQLHRATEGWPMGLVLAERNWPEAAQDETRPGYLEHHIGEYIEQEVLQKLPLNWKKTLIKWSLPDILPEPLARELAATQNIRPLLLGPLYGFVRVHPASDAGSFTEFSFHQLFQKTLRQLSTDVLGSERETTLIQAGQWFQSQQWLEASLQCYLEAEDFIAASQLLENNAAYFLMINQPLNMSSWLARFPEADLATLSPWVAFMKGTLAMELNPPEARPWLQQAAQGFAEKNQAAEELLALGQLLYYHWYAKPDFIASQQLLSRVEHLLNPLTDQESASPFLPRVLLIRSLAQLYCYGDLDNPKRWLEEADDLNQQKDSIEFKVQLEVGKILIALFACDWKQAMQSMEAAQNLLPSHEVTQLTYESLEMLGANLLLAQGKLPLYQQQKNNLAPDSHPLMQTTTGNPFICLWDIDACIAEGDYQKANELLAATLTQEIPGGTHMTSQLLGYAALLEALQGRGCQVENYASQALTLRQATGGPWFTCQAQLLISSAFILSGQDQPAQKYLRSAEKLCMQLDAPNLECLLLSNQAYLLLQQKKQELAHEKLFLLLRKMKLKGLDYFYGWSPPIMHALLLEAIQVNIFREKAAQLLRIRLNASATAHLSYPLLEVRLLGSEISLDYGSNHSLDSTQLSELQRQLLTLLATADKQAEHQEVLQAYFWPDATPSKGRANLDTLVSRTRRSLDTLVYPHKGKDYLKLAKGFLQLQHCRIDTEEFMEKAQTGLQEYTHKHYWQAGLQLKVALDSWPCAPYLSRYLSFTLQEKLMRLYKAVVVALAQCWKQQGKQEKAIQLLTLAFEQEPEESDFACPLHHWLLAQGENRQAQQVIETYRQALNQAGYTEEEAQEMLAIFWTPSTHQKNIRL